MDITVSEKYLWFPVDMSGEMVWVSVYDGDQKIQEMKVSLGKEHIDFYGVWKATEYLGKELRIVSEKGEEYLDGVDIRQEKTRPQNDYPYRPRLHYTPAYGWVNDPNGLVYVDGVYHMFHQYNPYSTEWQNMSWGHATSTDLMHWEEQEVASTPDEYGTMYSGCALVDEKNTAGYGKDALLFFYTAAGGMNEWSKEAGNLFTQKLMWSTDGTKTLHKRDEELVPWIVGENRDPKVFWHAESNAYVMIMYLEENDFLILRSADLLHWEQTQKMTVPGMWECPLLIEVPVEGTEEVIPADLVLIAAGFLGSQKYVTDAFKVATTARTNVETKPEAYETSVPRIFTAGDMHRGQSLVVWAIREGREAAKAVDESLMGYSYL